MCLSVFLLAPAVCLFGDVTLTPAGHGGAKAAHHCAEHMLSRVIDLAFPSRPEEEKEEEVKVVKMDQVIKAVRSAFRRFRTSSVPRCCV